MIEHTLCIFVDVQLPTGFLAVVKFMQLEKVEAGKNRDELHSLGFSAVYTMRLTDPFVLNMRFGLIVNISRSLDVFYLLLQLFQKITSYSKL